MSLGGNPGSRQVIRCLTGQALENQDGDLEVDTSSILVASGAVAVSV